MEKFTTTRIDAKTETGIAEHTDKYPVPVGEDANQYFQAAELNTINSKINENTADVKDLMLATNELIDETKKKIDDGFYTNNESGDNVFVLVGEYGKRDILLTNPALNSVAGIKTTQTGGVYLTPHIGKRYQMINKTGHDVVLVHNTASTSPNYAIKTLKGDNIILPNNQVIEFCIYPDGLYERFKTWEITSEYSRILINTGYVKTTSDFTLNANTEWIINGVPYTNSANVVLPIPLAASGMHRWDRVVLNTDNTAVLVQGQEFLLADEPPVPPLEDKTLEYTLFMVTDTEIGEPSVPLVGDDFVKKIYSANHDTNSVPSTQDAANFRVQVDVKYGKSHHRLNTELITGVRGFYVNTSYPEQPYEGKIFILHNHTGGSVKLYHNDYSSNSVSGASNVALLLRGAVDTTIPRDETLVLEWGKTDDSYVLKEVARSWSENVINSNQLLIFQADGNTTKNIEDIQAGDMVIGFVEGNFLNSGEYISGDPLTLAAYGL